MVGRVVTCFNRIRTSHILYPISSMFHGFSFLLLFHAGIVLLDLSESEEFIKTLDFATSHEVRRSIHLQCTAVGHYEYYPYAIGHEVLASAVAIAA